MTEVFFTSDTHFTDNRFNLLHRPFKSVQEQDETLIENWNRIVKTNDIVFHLGDVSTTEEGLQKVKYLNGEIHLIKGNYDVDKDENILNSLFASVSNNLTIFIESEPVYLNHYPTKGKIKVFNLVGHIHSLWKVQRNMINVSVECWNYTPVHIDTIASTINAIRNVFTEDVFAGTLKANLNVSKPLQ